MNIIKPFEFALEQKKAKNWDCIYVAVDIHGTIFKPTFSNEEYFDYYPYAKETLQFLSDRPDVKLILWSSSHFNKLLLYLYFLNADYIHIDGINSNEEVIDTELASFKDKFYFNVGLDNNFGFEPETDWKVVYDYVTEKFKGN